ncbi:MAG: hypothetical protein ACYSPI_12515 [Planctomycetota bacterium]
MKFHLLLCLTMPIIFITGCSTKLGDFTAISSKNVDLSNFSTQVGTGSKRVKGVDEGNVIFIFRNKFPNIEDAIDDALDKNNAYMLSDAVLRSETFCIPLIYTSNKFVVEGHPVSRESNKSIKPQARR